MGMFIISGTMGGGKSYYAAELALKCWKQGGIVHSNVPWDKSVLERRGFDKRHIVLPEDYTRWVRKEEAPDGSERMASDILVGGSEGQENLVIIDEAAFMFHMMDQLEAKKRTRCLFELVAMSRQIGVDMYFVSQAASNLDVGIRNMAEAEIRCVNVERLPGLGPIVAFVMGKFRRTWLSPMKRQVISAESARFSPEVGELYNTHGVGAKINLKRSDTRKVQKARLGFSVWVGLLALAFCIGYPLYEWKRRGNIFKPPPKIQEKIDKVSDTQTGPSGPLATPREVRYFVSQSSDGLHVADSLGRVYSSLPGAVYQFTGLARKPTCVDLYMATGETVSLQFKP